MAPLSVGVIAASLALTADAQFRGGKGRPSPPPTPPPPAPKPTPSPSGWAGPAQVKLRSANLCMDATRSGADVEGQTATEVKTCDGSPGQLFLHNTNGEDYVHLFQKPSNVLESFFLDVGVTVFDMNDSHFNNDGKHFDVNQTSGEIKLGRYSSCNTKYWSSPPCTDGQFHGQSCCNNGKFIQSDAGLCMTASQDGRLVLKRCTGQANQAWEWLPTGAPESVQV